MKKKKDNKKKVKYRRKELLEKVQRIASFLTAKRKEEEKAKKGRKSDKRSRTRQVLEKSGRLLSPGAFGTELALCQCCSTRIADKD